MKLSISLPLADIEFLDEYARGRDTSRSAAVHDAIESLRHGTLEEAYEAAFEEWAESEEATLWDRTSGDGL